MGTRMKDVTIVIPSLFPGEHELSKRALSFLIPSLKKTFDGETIVSFNGTGSGYPQGQCGAVNRVAETVKTKWLMVSNNDMYYPPGWFEKLFEKIDNFGLLVASPNLVEPNRGAAPFLQKFCGGLGGDFDEQCFLDFASNYKEHENRPQTSIEDGFNLPFVIRKDVWDTIGGYDISFDPWGSCSDTDLQTRIMIAGITPKRIRSALVYHFTNASGTFASENQPFLHKNWRYYEDKFGFKSPGAFDGVWYKPTIPYDKLKFKPEYMGKYGEPT